VDKEDVAIWTTGHDAIMSEVERKRRSDGFEPKAPLFSKAQLESRRVAVITHSWYVSTKGVHGALNHRGHPRTLHIIDERLKEIDQTDLGHADIIAARDSVTIVDPNGAKLNVSDVMSKADRPSPTRTGSRLPSSPRLNPARTSSRSRIWP
jgi:hypothetical protein